MAGGSCSSRSSPVVHIHGTSLWKAASRSMVEKASTHWLLSGSIETITPGRWLRLRCAYTVAWAKAASNSAALLRSDRTAPAMRTIEGSSKSMPTSRIRAPRMTGWLLVGSARHQHRQSVAAVRVPQHALLLPSTCQLRSRRSVSDCHIPGDLEWVDSEVIQNATRKDQRRRCGTAPPPAESSFATVDNELPYSNRRRWWNAPGVLWPPTTGYVSRKSTAGFERS